jgi:hypothetical protein
MSNDLLNFILAITSILTTITLFVTLAFLTWQTKQLGRQTEQNTIISYYQYYKDWTIALLQNEDASQRVLGESKEDAMAYLAFLSLSLTFSLRMKHLTDQNWWQSDEAVAKEVLRQGRIRLHWKRYKYLYSHRFIAFVEGILEELDREQPNSSTSASNTHEKP